MIESLLGDLFPAHANLTLRQRDVLLEDVKLPDKERESLRALPLFDKELFPTDFQALDERVTDQQLKLSSSQLFTQMLQKNTPSSAPAAKGTTSKPRKPKKQRQKPSQTQTSSRQSGSGGSRPAKKTQSAAKPKGNQGFRKGNKPSENT